MEKYETTGNKIEDITNIPDKLLNQKTLEFKYSKQKLIRIMNKTKYWIN